MMQNLVLGCDPEVFLIDPKNNKVISSVGLIGGSKDFPMPIGEGCAVQEDNVTVEFNTPPCPTVEAFIEHINYNKAWIAQRAAQMGLEMLIVPSVVMDEDQLQTDAARTFGCEPDFNAWTGGKENPRPSAGNANLRSAGGHIHVTVPEGVDKLEVVKAMDLFVGCQMLTFDKDNGRRELYGKAGAHRIKKYGVEYRTASNVWIQDSDKIAWAWAQTARALEYAASGKGFTEQQGEMIQECINNSDLDLLQVLQDEFQL